jgi:hypothetical protein
MPAPRLFEGPSEQRERWIHPLACLLGLCGPDTRPALVSELAGEDLPGAADATVREAQPLGDGRADILVRDRDGRWAVVILSTLGYDADLQAAIESAHAALADKAERIIGVVITPDRKPPAAVTAAAAGGLDVRHKSWLRVRDWVQERPERGNAQGVDAALLREAEYFYTPRVAELYRLEEFFPTLPQNLRPVFAGIYFDLNDLHIAPAITHPSTGVSHVRISFPRSGEAAAEITLDNGALAVRVKDGDWSSVAVTSGAVWTANRSEVLASARRMLPAPR